MNFGTRLLHNGNELDPHTGASSVPLYQASTYHQADIDHPGNYDYGALETRRAKRWNKRLPNWKGDGGGLLLLQGWQRSPLCFFSFLKGIIWWFHGICTVARSGY